MIVVVNKCFAVKRQIKRSKLGAFKRITVLLVAVLSSLWFPHVNASSDNIYPKSINIELDNGEIEVLQLTGHAIRKKFLLEIYTIAHYSDVNYIIADNLNAENSVFNTILSPYGTKQITMKFQRKLRAKQIQKALAEGIIKNCVGNEIEEVQPYLLEFLNAINADITKYDEFSIRWTNEGHLLAYYQGELVGNFNSPLLAKLLWSMWFGKKAVVDRNKMIEELNITGNRTE